jgi:hypothetical protein
MSESKVLWLHVSVSYIHVAGLKHESVAESDQTTFAKQRVKAVFPAVSQEITNR